MINIHSLTSHKGKKYWCVTPEPLPTAILCYLEKSGKGIKMNPVMLQACKVPSFGQSDYTSIYCGSARSWSLAGTV